MPRSRGRTVAAAVAAAVVLAAGVASLATVLETDAWWIRVLAFPKTQLFFILLVSGPVYFVLGRPMRGLGILVALIWLVALGHTGWALAPFTGLRTAAVTEVARCEERALLRVLLVNLKRGNEQLAPLRDLVGETQPHLMLAVETDQWWDRQLDTLNDTFPYRLKAVDDARNFFGMHLLSRLPIVDGQIRYLADNDVPSVVADIDVPGPAQTLRFVGLHPRPPQIGETAEHRDLQLTAGAELAAAAPGPAVIAGDFNAVPWERIFHAMAEIGDMRDPRVGRGLYNTYQIDGVGTAWPLDHILVRGVAGLTDFRRGPDIGSDHLPVLATLCLRPAP